MKKNQASVARSSGVDIEIERNLRVFREKLQNLKLHHAGRYVLMHSEEIVGIYDTVRDAQTTGAAMFSDGIFSIQKVSSDPINLGYFSYALPVAAAQ